MSTGQLATAAAPPDLRAGIAPAPDPRRQAVLIQVYFSDIMKSLMKIILVSLLSLAPALLAQEFRGAISGAVTDPSGALVAGASVLVVETQTGTRVQAVSDTGGQYTAPFLLPGDYNISVKMDGFKEALRKAVHVGAGEHPIIDIRLDVGETSQSVEVTADAPLVNSENASVGHAITTKEVEDFPLNGRSPMMLAQLEIGVIYSPFTGTSGGSNSGSMVQQPYESSNNFSIGGTPTQSSEMLINGAPNATWDMRSAFSAPQDAVQEVRVKAFDTDTSFGHTRGGTINQVLKTGTNTLHGSLYEFNQPSNLTANSFFNNRNGLGNPVTHFNQYGATAGGPAFIPKVLDGKNKLFWFVAWENDVNSQPFTNFISVPSAAEKRGDFSQILAADKTQLYDPYSGALTGSTVNRTPLANNQIPASRINPIAAQYLKFYPEPNVFGFSTTARSDGYDNYGTTAPNTNHFNNELGRLDYNMTDRSRLAVDIRHNALDATKNDYFQNIASGTLTRQQNWGASLDEVYTLSPTSVLNLRLNYTFMYNAASDPSVGFDPTSLGFPGYMAANSDRLALPYMYFSTSTNFQSLGTNSAAKRPSQSLQLFGTWTKIKGNHAFKIGADLRQYRLSTITYQASAGSFNFGANSWVRASSGASSTVAMGQDMAQFLYGLPDQGFYDINTYGSWYSYYSSGFLQDDWRVRRNLTLNLGVRFDHDGPYHEKWARTANGFGFNTPSPIAAQAIANYKLNPAPQLPASQFNVPGGLTYPANGASAVYQNTSHLASPRVGFAWSPDCMKGKTVVRGGVGMFVAPITIATLAQNGNYSSNPIINQEGFSQETTMTVTGNNYLYPGPATLSDPFPGGAILQPAGQSLGAATFLGQTVAFLNPQMKSPYSVRWNFGFQHSISPNMMLEMLYIGNHSVHLPVNLTQLNGIPRQYLSTLGVRDQPLVTALNASTPNPFNKLIAAGTPAGATTSVAQLLSFYPEFPLGYTSGGFTGSGGVMEQNLNVGSSYFHSLNVRFQRRLSGGLTVIGNYIFSKLMEQDTWLNDTDPRPEKRVSPFDHTHRGVLALRYELPFKAASRKANLFIGGWHVNAIYTKQTGQPFTWMGTSSTTIGDLVYFGAPLQFNSRETNGLAFNTSAFDTKTANQFAYHIRTFSTTFSSLRGDGTNELSASMLKRFDIREKMYLQLRLECFNVLNRPTFQFPNLAPTNSAFGLITGTSNRARSIQLGGRFVF